jgi:hypothetical protein
MPLVPDNNQNWWNNGKISEKISGISPGVSSIAVDGESRSTIVYIVDGPENNSDIQNPLDVFCQRLLGSVEINEVNGSLKRTPPMTHPQYRWLYADRISSIKGIGPKRIDPNDNTSRLFGFNTDATSSWQYVPPYYSVYEKYEIVVEFSSRPYIAIDDNTMDLLEIKDPGLYKITSASTPPVDGIPDNVYYKDNGAAVTVSGTPFREYRRFVSYTTETSAEYLTFKAGAYMFESDVDAIKNQPIAGFFGKILIPKVVVKLTWHMVPYYFIDPKSIQGTNLFEGLGRVNQKQFFGFDPGELLFTGFTNVPKPKAQFTNVDYSLGSVTETGVPNINEIMNIDITFNFLYIPIFSYDQDGNPYPSRPNGIINPNNKSYINAGHNLGPANYNKKYYPIVSKDPLDPVVIPTNLQKEPVYGSYPFELMFNAKPYTMAT